MSVQLTAAQHKVLLCLSAPKSCTEVGEEVFDNPYRRTRQAFARPTGKILRQLERMGLVTFIFDKFKNKFVWYRTPRGHRFAHERA